MATPAQITANQLNAAKSTGPKTTEGKAASSQNARRHGLTVSDATLERECPRELAELLAGLVAEHQPRTETAHALVKQLAMAVWRIRRFDRVETALWDLTEDDFDGLAPIEPKDQTREDASRRSARQLLGTGDLGKALDRLHRYRSQADQQLHRALRALQALRKQPRPNGPNQVTVPIQAHCQTSPARHPNGPKPPAKPAPSTSHLAPAQHLAPELAWKQADPRQGAST